MGDIINSEPSTQLMSISNQTTHDDYLKVIDSYKDCTLTQNNIFISFDTFLQYIPFNEPLPKEELQQYLQDDLLEDHA